jgi:thiopurine S-methyltransferase
MLWLEQQGMEVTGVELAGQAVQDFCRENGLAFSVSKVDACTIYQLRDRNIRLVVDDFLHFSESYNGARFDSIYDRAALVALPQIMRKEYVAACQKSLCDRPSGLLVSLEYEQELMQGPPFSVSVEEVQRLWPGMLSCMECTDALETLPKAREAGISRLEEYTWRFVV